MARVKHQLVIFDRHLCSDPDVLKILTKALKSNLLLSVHFSRQSKPEDIATLSICGADILEAAVEIQSILSPIIPAVSTLPEIFAAIDLLNDKKWNSSDEETDSLQASIDWDQFSLLLMPHVLFPPQEGYRVIIFSKKTLVFNGWLQQPNCLLFLVVKVTEVNMAENDEHVFGMGETLKFLQPVEGYVNTSISPLESEWDAFFKLSMFEKPDFPLVIHFSSSIYSKLIISCVGKPRCLTGSNEFTEPVTVLETVSRTKTSGICQSLVVSESYIVSPRDGSRFKAEDNRDNKMRFQELLKVLHEDDAVLVLRSNSAIKNYYILIPSLEERAFMLNKIACFEMLLPEHARPLAEARNGSVDFDDNEEAIAQEVNAALSKIPMKDYYEPLNYSSGLVQWLEGTMLSGKKQAPRLSTRGRTTRGGRGSTKKRTYTPVVSAVSKK